jgi:hypothetical protein
LLGISGLLPGMRKTCQTLTLHLVPADSKSTLTSPPTERSESHRGSQSTNFRYSCGTSTTVGAFFIAAMWPESVHCSLQPEPIMKPYLFRALRNICVVEPTLAIQRRYLECLCCFRSSGPSGQPCCSPKLRLFLSGWHQQ